MAHRKNRLRWSAGATTTKARTVRPNYHLATKGGIQMGIIYGLEELAHRNEKYEIIRQDIIENDNVDVCIIGSGAGGAVLAKELVEVW